MNPHAKIISAEIDERRLMRYGRLTAFKDEKSAAIAGAWFAGLNGNEKAARFAAENGAPVMKAAGESINSAGGALVPDVLMKTIIALREERGAFRRNAQIVPMASDNATTPRRTGGLTAYFPQSENTTITESQNVWDNVGLTVSKLAVLTRSSSELYEDALVDLGQWFATEISYAFASKEDDCGFNGDGTLAYAGIRGICKLLVDNAHNAGKVSAAAGHNTFGTVDNTDLTSLISTLPAYAMPNAKFFLSQSAFALCFCRLAATAGGIVNTPDGPEFLGFDVERVQVMPQSGSQVGNVMVLFGDLSLAAALGERRGVSVARSEGRYLDQDQVAWRGTERIDINNHDLGDNNVAGPIVGLIGTT